MSIEREERIWEWSLEGLTVRAIADRLNAEGLGPVAKSTVHDALKRAQQRALDGLTDRIAADKVVRAERLEFAYREAMQAWLASKRPYQAMREKTVERPGPPALPGDKGPAAPSRDRREEYKEIREREGEVCYLHAALAALAATGKLLGTDAPEVKKIAGVKGEPVEVDLAFPELRAIVGRLATPELEQFHALLLKLDEPDGAGLALPGPGA